MIVFTTSVDDVTETNLAGFFEGWPSPPSPTTHLRVLRGSDHVVVAWDGDLVVGFVTAITDGVLSAYMPLLEVLPSHRSRGIGRELVRRLLADLDGLYMVDTACDDDLTAFYESLGFSRGTAMIRRDYDAQAGRG